jgi:ABC-type glutathione transport system ATPase component
MSPEMAASSLQVTVAPGEFAAPLLRLHDVQIGVVDTGGRETERLVHDVELTIQRGDCFGIVGESGSGKTLTCRAMLGELPGRTRVVGGQIFLDDSDLVQLSASAWRDLRSRRVGAVFQDPASYLNPALSVGRQLSELLRVKAGFGRRAARERTLELLSSVGLQNPVRVYRQIPSDLSGGMQQRVTLAMAISCGPDLLVADEPTTALDVKTQSEIVALLLELREREGLTIVFVSHDLALVTDLCNRVAVFHEGRIVEQGATAQLLAGEAQHPYVQSLVASAGIGYPNNVG